MKKEDSIEELMKGIDWNRYLPIVIGIMQPVLIFGGWLAFAKFDKRADALSKLIAIAEPIPTVDLNLPRPVVLASLYHATDEALQVLNDVIDFLKDVEIPSKDEIVEEIKETLKETVVEEILDPITGEGITDLPQFVRDFNACKKNAEDTLGILYNKYTGSPWIISCMIQKGYHRNVVEQWVKNKLGI